MAANAFDRIKRTASGAVVIGTAVAARAARTAGPLVDRAIGAIRSRVGDSGKPPAGTAPVTVTPAPIPPGEPEPAPSEAPGKPAEPSTKAPTPAAVAKNIPPHPPQPEKTPVKKPVKKSAPGAKLPPRRKPTGS